MNLSSKDQRRERAETLEERQARHLSARFRLPITIAALVAELALAASPRRA